MPTEDGKPHTKVELLEEILKTHEAISKTTLMPPTRERSLALTKLEEAHMWLQRATGY